jgi:hypothetical protein
VEEPISGTDAILQNANVSQPNVKIRNVDYRKNPKTKLQLRRES